ncbi:MAG: HAD family acid phosphatase [Rickettsiales bacterium]|nr:HAD family acid phosphatase [Rickettsiales bacterium]
MKQKIPTIFCDIDGVLTQKFAIADYDRFGEPNENMVRILNSLARDFTIIFITGRWAIGQEKVENFIKSVLPDVNAIVFCKPSDYPGTTAEYKLAKVKELEAAGYEFYIGFDDFLPIVGMLHNHGMFVAQVISD